MRRHTEFYRQSIDQPDVFWTNEARFINWHKPFAQVCDYPHPSFAKWFVGGETNLCYNAVDRHAAERPHEVMLAVDEKLGDSPPRALIFRLWSAQDAPRQNAAVVNLGARGRARFRRSQHARRPNTLANSEALLAGA